MADSTEITRLLRAWQDGDEGALDELTVSVYDELRRLAGSAFRGERAGHTLQPTALVNEAFVSLVGADISWESRAHFFALSARMMRRILMNHAEARNAQKRGGPVLALTLDENLVAAPPAEERFTELDEAITSLAAFDQRKADLVELQIFGGLTFEEMAEVTGLSSSTLDRELRTAKAWLKKTIAGSASQGASRRA
jgi:RNA polymerase sigma factor (TIGR02999 family)